MNKFSVGLSCELLTNSFAEIIDQKSMIYNQMHAPKYRHYFTEW